MSDGGKGSAPRQNRDDKSYSENWEKIFGKKLKESREVPEEKDED